MKCTIDRKDLVAALAVVKPAATSRGKVPILANVALATKGSKLFLSCTDLDLSIQTKVEATIEDQGSTNVNAATLANLVNSFNGAAVRLEALTHDLKIHCGDSKYKLSSLPSDDLPPAIKLKDPTGFVMPQPELHRLLAETSFCQGTDEARVVLCSSMLRLNGSITAVACDGRRVAVEQSPLEGDKLNADLLLPTKTTRELLRLLSSEEPEEEGKEAQNLNVTVGSNGAQFDLGATTITSKLIEGTYPDYNKVIPKDLKEGVPVGRTDLLNILRRVHLIADMCSLEFDGQTLTVRARGTKECPGEAIESLLIPKTKAVTVNFNIQYLIEALAAVSADEVLLHVQNANSPCVMKIKGWTCVTMCMTDKPAVKAEETKKEEPAKK